MRYSMPPGRRGPVWMFITAVITGMGWEFGRQVLRSVFGIGSNRRY